MRHALLLIQQCVKKNGVPDAGMLWAVRCVRNCSCMKLCRRYAASDPTGKKKGLRWVPKPLLTLNLIPWKTLQIYAYNVTHANISTYFFYILYFLNGIRRLINNWLSYKLFPRLVGRYGGHCGTESVAIPEHSGWDIHRSRVPRKHLKAYPQVTSERNAVEIVRPENLTDVYSRL